MAPETPSNESSGPDPTRCERCGQVHERCSAHRKGSDPLEPCGQWPVRGATVCRMHGAGGGAVGRRRAPARTAADRRVARGRVGKAIARLATTEPDAGHVTGIGELQGALWEARVWTAHLTELAGELDDVHADGRPDVVMAMLGEWQDRRARYARWVVEAGVDEAQMRLLDTEAERVVRAIFATLDDPTLLEALLAGDRERARRIAGGHLRALGPGEAAA